MALRRGLERRGWGFSKKACRRTEKRVEKGLGGGMDEKGQRRTG